MGAVVGFRSALRIRSRGSRQFGLVCQDDVPGPEALRGHELEGVAGRDVFKNGLARTQQNWRRDDMDLVNKTPLQAGCRKSIATHPQQSVTGDPLQGHHLVGDRVRREAGILPIHFFNVLENTSFGVAFIRSLTTGWFPDAVGQ